MLYPNPSLSPSPSPSPNPNPSPSPSPSPNPNPNPLAKQELGEAREAFARGLAIDYQTARTRLSEAVHFLLPACAILGPSMRAAITTRC